MRIRDRLILGSDPNRSPDQDAVEGYVWKPEPVIFYVVNQCKPLGMVLLKDGHSFVIV